LRQINEVLTRQIKTYAKEAKQIRSFRKTNSKKAIAKN